MSRCNAILLLCITLVSSSAFSDDAPSSTTTRARIVGPGGLESSRTQGDEEVDPATGLARTTVVRPLHDFPQGPGASPSAAPLTPPAGPGAPAPSVPPPGAVMGSAARGHLALILPTASPTLGRLAEAVRQGFAAAASAAGHDAPPVDFIAVADEGLALLAACHNSQGAGALLVIAAITRDGATALVKSDCARQPVLELNEPQVLAPDLPQNVYTVSLSVEQEARQVALMAVADGRRSAIVISSASPIARRAQDAFEREWSRAAGEIRHLAYSGNPEDGPALRERLEAMPGDMTFLALEAADARAVRPYVSATLPVYATSLSVNPRAESIVNLDLQGVRYLEMPWFVQADHPAVMVYPQPSTPMSVDQERLYAFGIDAFRLALHLLRGDARRAPLDGVTGRITLESGNAFTRTLVPAEIDGGKVIPLRPQ